MNSWDSQSEFDPTVTLCSDHLSALLGWPHSLTFSLSRSVSLSLPLSPSPSHRLSTELREQEEWKDVCVLLNASCVCLCSSSCHPLPLCRHCGLSMLQWSEEKGMCFKHHCIYRPFPHVISPVLLAAHTEAPFQQSHLYTSYFTHWIMWRVKSPVKLQRTLWLLYRFCIRVQVGKLRPLKLPFRQQCRFFFPSVHSWNGAIWLLYSDDEDTPVFNYQKRVRITSKNKIFEKFRFIFHSCFLF